MSVSYPVISDENGDITVYYNAQDLRKIESVDVENDEYRFYDALGRRLQASIDADDHVVLTLDPVAGPPSSVATALVKFMRTAEARGATLSTAQQTALSKPADAAGLIAVVDKFEPKGPGRRHRQEAH